MEQRPSWELACSQLVKTLPPFYGTQVFFAAFTRSRHLSLSWARSIQSMTLHPTSWRYILILSYHLRLGLRRSSFTQVYPLKPCKNHSCPPYVLHAPSISFLSLLVYIRYKLCKSLIENESWRNKTSICEHRTVNLEMLTEVVFTGGTIFFLKMLYFATPLE
jgi:hypothetical protein